MNEQFYVGIIFGFWILVFTTLIFLIVTIVAVIKWFFIKRKVKSKLLITTSILLIFTTTAFYQIYFNLNFLPEGEHVSSLTSPSGQYEIHTYNLPIFSSAKAILENKETKRSKTIYYGQPVFNPKVKWITDDLVQVNATKLNIKQGDTYDYRHDRK